MLEVENRVYYDLFDVIISLNNNNNLLGEQGMAAKMHVVLLSRSHLTEMSETRPSLRGASQFVRTAVFSVFHHPSLNVTQAKSNHRCLFLSKIENCYVPSTHLCVTNRTNNVIRYVEWTSTRVVGKLSQWPGKYLSTPRKFEYLRK
jgi:hypothetical protein